uniref:Uncharacterized protein n=1 Tax=Leptobrachium leishanense TaxID=445787 RepID=A0A8C5PLR3_9ANUR
MLFCLLFGRLENHGCSRLDNLPDCCDQYHFLRLPLDGKQRQVITEKFQVGHSRPHPREKRFVSSIAMRGCHLGTCQTQNLANMLYRLGKNNFKDGSNKDTSDPLGYGRKRRSLVENPQRTDFLEKLLAT